MMIIVLRNLFALLILSIGMLSGNANAQVPVTVTSDIPATLNHTQTMGKWAANYTQMTNTIQQLKTQSAAITGNRGLGQIYNNPSLRNYLPDEWASIYDKVKSGKLKTITGAASTVASNESFDPTATGGKKRYEDTLAANKAMSMQAYDRTLERVNNINSLMQQANATQDTKAAADLQNRMAAENAMIQNEQIRLALMAQLQQAELKLAEEQRAREFDTKFLQ